MSRRKIRPSGGSFDTEHGIFANVHNSVVQEHGQNCLDREKEGERGKEREREVKHDITIPDKNSKKTYLHERAGNLAQSRALLRIVTDELQLRTRGILVRDGIHEFWLSACDVRRAAEVLNRLGNLALLQTELCKSCLLYTSPSPRD